MSTTEIKLALKAVSEKYLRSIREIIINPPPDAPPGPTALLAYLNQVVSGELGRRAGQEFRPVEPTASIRGEDRVEALLALNVLASFFNSTGHTEIVKLFSAIAKALGGEISRPVH
jgi:hypothetical protein